MKKKLSTQDLVVNLTAVYASLALLYFAIYTAESLAGSILFQTLAVALLFGAMLRSFYKGIERQLKPINERTRTLLEIDDTNASIHEKGIGSLGILDEKASPNPINSIFEVPTSIHTRLAKTADPSTVAKLFEEAIARAEPGSLSVLLSGWPKETETPEDAFAQSVIMNALARALRTGWKIDCRVAESKHSNHFFESEDEIILLLPVGPPGRDFIKLQAQQDAPLAKQLREDWEVAWSEASKIEVK